MLYLALLGLFHLGLVVPWALEFYNVARIPCLVPTECRTRLLLIIYFNSFFSIRSLLWPSAHMRTRRNLSTKMTRTWRA